MGGGGGERRRGDGIGDVARADVVGDVRTRVRRKAGGVRARERGEGETGEGVVFARGDDGDAARRRGEVRGGRGRDVVRGRRATHAQFKR